MVALKGLSARTREHGEVPLGSAFVEAEDVKGTVAALDFAITVIGTVPLVEDFDHLDPIHVQTKRPGYLNPMVLTGLDHDAHVSASAAAQASSRRSIPSVHAFHAKRNGGVRSHLVEQCVCNRVPSERDTSAADIAKIYSAEYGRNYKQASTANTEYFRRTDASVPRAKA